MTACTFPVPPENSYWKCSNTRYHHSYRITSFSVHLSPPNTWHTAFTLSRIPSQPSLLPALQIPTSDQLDDWRDYQRLKLIDRGDDFAMLHEILAQPLRADEEIGEAYSRNDGRHGSQDSGYYSRRDSKATSTGDGKRDSVLTEEMEEISEVYEGAEEADDEGAGLEDDEEDEDDNRAELPSKNRNNHHTKTKPVSQSTLLLQTKPQT